MSPFFTLTYGLEATRVMLCQQCSFLWSESKYPMIQVFHTSKKWNLDLVYSLIEVFDIEKAIGLNSISLISSNDC